MASSAGRPPATIVGNAFVCQYYHILYQSPELGHRFYQDMSKLSRPEPDGRMSTTTTLQAINEKILSMRNSDPDCKTEIVSIIAQDSHNGGVFVLVSGFMTGKGSRRRAFSQAFFLAPQDKGYFVLNDMLRYVPEMPNQGKLDAYQASPATEAVAQDSENFAAPVENASGEGVCNPPQNAHQTNEEAEGPKSDVADEIPDDSQDVTESTTNLEDMPINPYTSTLVENASGEGVCNPPQNAQQTNEEAEGPQSDVADEIPDDSQDVTESTTDLEDMPINPYTSTVRASPAVLSIPASTAVETASMTQDNQVVAASGRVHLSETLSSSIHVVETGHKQDVEAEGYSIYIRGLPLNSTRALVEKEFKKFGPIKSDGVQVKFQRDFCFGFAEFEAPGAVQSALKASPILINGRQVFVEEKRSTNRGNVRGRFSFGRGTSSGYRTEGPRDRNFGRGDFHGRADYGNRSRSGSSYRGTDGYARGDQMGTHGGRSTGTDFISKSV